MIESLINFAKQLEQDWSIKDHPQKAKDFLSDLKVTQSLKDFELEVNKLLLNIKVPEQLNLYNNFGEPSLTIFNNGKFAVDIYFWRKNDTLIHSHGFRGSL